MKYLRLGTTDLRISMVGIGGMSFGSAGWMAGTEKAAGIVKKAMDLGINYIDTANIYSKGQSEEIIGKATEGLRENLVISTKVGGKFSRTHSGFSRTELEYGLRESLKRLRMESLDIYFLHTWFDHLDAGEIIATLSNMAYNGRIGYYGLSNVSGYQLAEIDSTASERNLERPQIVQNHYNAVYREDDREVVPYCRKKSITISPFSPLAAGFLTGKYRRGQEPDSVRAAEYPVMKQRYFHENDFDILDAVLGISEEIDASPASVSLAYLLSKGFLPVVGISDSRHLEDVERAMEINMQKDQVNRIEERYLPHEVMKGSAGY